MLKLNTNNLYVKLAMSLIQDDEDYETTQNVIETELAIEVYERRLRTSRLPEKEIEELKRIVGALKLLNSYEIRIVTVMVKQWSTKRAPAYVFFVTSSFDKLIGGIRTESPGSIFNAN